MKQFIVAISLIACFSLSAQHVRVINLKSGLSDNFVESILQDKQGYIWIGTRDGLNRYNGYETEIFRSELTSSFIYSLMQDSKGEIWIGTSHGGVTVYSPEMESFSNLASQNKSFETLATKDVYDIYEDKFQNVWLCTLQGLARIPLSRDTIVWYKVEHDNYNFPATCIYEDTVDNKILVGTDRGLYSIADSDNTLVHERMYEGGFSTNAFIRDIKGDGSNLWFATNDQAIFRYDRKLRSMTNYSSANDRAITSNQCWKIFIDTKKNVWAAFINGGIYRYESKTNRFTRYQQHIADAFNSISITGIAEDTNGNIWVASHGDGACYFNPDQYVFEKYLSGQKGSSFARPTVVSAFMEDKEGEVWIGTDGEGIMKMNGKQITPLLSRKNGLLSNTILDMLEDKGNGKWFATWQGGVAHLPSSSKLPRVFTDKNNDNFGLRSSDVKALMVDSLSNIWMVTHGQGIFIYSTIKGAFINPLTIQAGLTSEIAKWGSDILRAKNGDIWIGSHAGLFRYRGDTIETYVADGGSSSLSSSLIYCLYEDANGSIWVGTSSSLEKFIPESKSFENYTAKFQVPGNIKCILADDEGDLWISTMNTLVEFDPRTNKMKYFGPGHNIQQGQFYECSCMKSKEGKMFFGGTEGFNAFWPDSVISDPFSSSLMITDLLLFNQRQIPSTSSVLSKAMPYTNHIDVPQDQNVISFKFSALTYSASLKNLYSYKMEGFDSDWSPLSESRMATYTNLDPGKYVFKVRAVSMNNITLGETQLSINIVPPFWKTIWFRSLIIIVIVFLIVGYLLLRLYASRQKRLQLIKLVEEKTREVREQNLLLENQKKDLQVKNNELTLQERKIREQAHTLERQKDELQKNYMSLQDLNATKDRLFSIIAHDLRNPFASLLGFTRLLYTDSKKYSDNEKEKIVGSLYHSSVSIYSLLDNLLVWSKSQQDTLTFSPEKIFYKVIMYDHFDLVQEACEKKSIKLVLNGSDDVSFFADKNMFSIIVRNLLSNAIRYSPVGGKIEIGFMLDNKILTIYVKDEGTGIDHPDELFKVSRADNRDHNHGLGLILCKEFVTRHGGEIGVRNNNDRGAYFYFTLPSADAEIVTDSTSISYTTLLSESSTNSVQEPLNDGKVILIAEDDDEIRWFMKHILFPDFMVIEAVNGMEAEALAIEKHPDMIISDITMPKMDGLNLCRKIKENAATSHIPFLLVTAEHNSKAKVNGFQFGADDYITKPIDANVLKARVHNIFENRRKLKLVYKNDITSEPEIFTSNTVDQKFLEKLNAIIEKRIADPDLNPDTLARDVNMSRTGLYMKVKAITGESVGIYIRNIRLKESKKLLRERHLNISEVAYSVGFNQLPYFTTCFKEAFGITPKEFVAGKGVTEPRQ